METIKNRWGTYRQVAQADVPSTIRFDVLGRDQGQTVEIAWGTRDRGEAGAGERWMRIDDRSESHGPRYYRRVRIDPSQTFAARLARQEQRIRAEEAAGVR